MQSFGGKVILKRNQGQLSTSEEGDDKPKSGGGAVSGNWNSRNAGLYSVCPGVFRLERRGGT